MESNSTPAKDKVPAKPPVDVALATTGPQPTLSPGDSFNAGGHPTLNT